MSSTATNNMRAGVHLTASDHYGLALASMADGQYKHARAELGAAIASIDATGIDAHMRGDLAHLLDVIAERQG